MECELEATPHTRPVQEFGRNNPCDKPPVCNLTNHPQVEFTRTILIAIEDLDEASVLSYGLKAAGIRNPIGWFKDSTALIGHLARFRTCENSRFDNSPLILALDTSLHGGIEALKWIREQSGFAKLPTIAVTSTKHPDEIESVYKAGAHWHLSKSTDFTDLMRLVRRIREFWSYAISSDVRAIPDPKAANYKSLTNAFARSYF